MKYTHFFIVGLDNNQFQLNLFHDTSNDAVASLGVENVAYHENNDMHRTNNRKWTDKQKQWIVKINTEKRTREKNVIKRVKEKCDIKFPTVARTVQTLINCVRRF